MNCFEIPTLSTQPMRVRPIFFPLQFFLPFWQLLEEVLLLLDEVFDSVCLGYVGVKVFENLRLEKA